MTTKFSRKREAIINIVRSTDTHPSAEWVYNSLKGEYPDISLGTVYRNLAAFKKNGVLASVGVVNGEERFDRDTSDHVHFICDGCARVIDVEVQRSAAEEDAARALSERYGARVLRRSLSFYGICENCSES
jgi:Fur family peroxide stress response transcriptional regulator